MISKYTLDFLSALKENNNKEWFDANRSVFEAAKKEFTDFVQELIPAMGKWMPELKGVEAKKCVFRIYRDVRFAKDKTPYKHNFAASISPSGKKGSEPGFYIHIEPGASFVACGVYQPSPEQLHAIRQEIDYNLDEFVAILEQPSFKKSYKELLNEDKLKTAPKGYPKDHPGIEYLKNRHFISLSYLKDKEVLAENMVKEVDKLCKIAQPLNSFLQRALD